MTALRHAPAGAAFAGTALRAARQAACWLAFGAFAALPAAAQDAAAPPAAALAEAPVQTAPVRTEPGNRPVRQARAYIPSDQLVSFLPTTTFDEFLAFLTPTFVRVTGKPVVDPMGRHTPIGVSIAGMHFIDAFEVVLDRLRLNYRETDRYFVIEDAPQTVGALGTDGVSSQAAKGEAKPLPASASSREIRIDALVFELNVDRLREVGTNWATVFGTSGGSEGGTGGSGGGSGTGSGTGGGSAFRLFVRSGRFFDSFSEYLTGPEQVDLADLLGLFRYFEQERIGETIAAPSVTVQSGETGLTQSGADIPVTVQDFAGNTITQYVPTGIIIKATPTLISDASDAPGEAPVEFIHLDIEVEKSSGSPSASGVVIRKDQADTQALLLDGEQTVIGGLFSTEESVSRKGVPILKDIPLVKYLFSYEQKQVIQKELLIVLQARVVEPLRTRAGRPAPQNIYEERREDVRGRLDRFKPGTSEDFRLIEPGAGR